MKKITSFLITLLIVFSVSPHAFCEETPHPKRVCDNANLLQDDQKAVLEENLDTLSSSLSFDIVVVTSDSSDGKTPIEFADDFFDYGGYGLNDSHDGVLFFICMDVRECVISVSGLGNTVFNYNVQQDILDETAPYLSDSDYFSAFEKFASLCESEINEYRENPESSKYVPKNDEYYDNYEYNTYEDDEFSIPGTVIISVVIGFIISLITVSIMKSHLRSVRFQPSAENYSDGQGDLTNAKEVFLYSTVTRSAKPKEEPHSFSSPGMHTSSSGNIHTSSSRKF